jgi:hypothetical protein
MHQSYCLDCGSYTAIDDATNLCASCYGHWAATSEPAARTVS